MQFKIPLHFTTKKNKIIYLPLKNHKKNQQKKPGNTKHSNYDNSIHFFFFFADHRLSLVYVCINTQ